MGDSRAGVVVASRSISRGLGLIFGLTLLAMTMSGATLYSRSQSWLGSWGCAYRWSYHLLVMTLWG